MTYEHWSCIDLSHCPLGNEARVVYRGSTWEREIHFRVIFSCKLGSGLLSQ